MTHSMKLNPGPFEKLASGQKTVELRLYDEKRRKLSVGDHIVFTCTEGDGRSLRALVTALHPFPSFEALYAALPLEKCGYSPEELPRASHRDMEAYYSPREQAMYGVLGIGLELV